MINKRSRNMQGLLTRRFNESEGGDRLKEEEGFDWGMFNPANFKGFGGDREFDPMHAMGKIGDAVSGWLGGGDDEEKAKVMKEYKDPEEGYHSVGEEAYMNYGKKGSGADSDFGVLAESKKRDDEGLGGSIARGLSRTFGPDTPSAPPASMPTMHDAPEYVAEQEAWKKMAAANPDQFEKEKIIASTVGPDQMDQMVAQSGVMPDTPLGPDALDVEGRIDQSIPTAAGPQLPGRHGPVAGPVDGPSPHSGGPVASLPPKSTKLPYDPMDDMVAQSGVEGLLSVDDAKKKKKKKGLSKSEKAGYAKLGEILSNQGGTAQDMRPPTAPALSIKQGQIAFPGLLASQAPVHPRYTPRGLV